MKLADYHQFTQTLTTNLRDHPHVLGLIALGSMANQDYQPDNWSDHDFFVIVTPGTQPQFKNDLSWLPNSDEIVLAFAETAHGMKVLYQFGHLLEFAIFEASELDLARVNRYAVLIDKADIGRMIAERARETAVTSQSNPPTDHNLYGQFLTNIFVGVGRHARGEQISGRIFVTAYAINHLIRLITRHYDAPEKGVLDNLDPYRRFERVYPQMGQQLNDTLNQSTPEAALGLLSLSEIWLSDKITHFPQTAVSTLKTYIEKI